MKIKFNTGDYRENCPEELTFEIVGISFMLDKEDIPVDIAIYGSEETLEKISEFSRIGFNIQPLKFSYENEEYIERGATHECLCARLTCFKLIDANKALDAKRIIYL